MREVRHSSNRVSAALVSRLVSLEGSGVGGASSKMVALMMSSRVVAKLMLMAGEGAREAMVNHTELNNTDTELNNTDTELNNTDTETK